MEKLGKKQLGEKLAGIELLSLDVDGVLTDGGLYYTDDGHQLRKFNVKDGEGIKRAMQAGVEVTIITASKADVITKRAADLGVKHVFPGVDEKLSTLEGLCTQLGIGLDKVAHIGDDLNDLPLLNAVGLSLTVADAMPDVIECVAYVTDKPGGCGAVREIIDIMVAAKG